MEKIKLKKRSLDELPFSLRKRGVIPGLIFGDNLEYKPIKLNRYKLLEKINSKQTVFEAESPWGRKYVVIDKVQRHPITNDLLHFSLRTLEEKKLNNVDVPVVFKGKPIGVKKGEAINYFKKQTKHNWKTS